MIAVVFFIVLSICLYRKLRKTQQRLKIEVKDVRNLPVVSSSIEMEGRKRKYMTLVEQNESEFE